MSEKEQAVSLTPSQLKELLMAMAAELRKGPEPTEEQKAALDQAQKSRRELAEQIKQEHENKKWAQRTCTHIRSNGSTCAVHVANMGFMICQHCFAIIFPQGHPGAAALPDSIQDTPMFNRLFQLEQEQSSGMSA